MLLVATAPSVRQRTDGRIHLTDRRPLYQDGWFNGVDVCEIPKNKWTLKVRHQLVIAGRLKTMGVSDYLIWRVYQSIS